MSGIDIVFSFDTTGSMSPCIGVVRQQIQELVNKLFSEIEDLRIGIISHGDYCDGIPNNESRVSDRCAKNGFITAIDLSSNKDEIVKMVKTAPNTGGGDAPEAYEYVLWFAKKFSWRKDATKLFVLIGDDIPHGIEYAHQQVKLRIDWRSEVNLLREEGIKVYGVQALNRSYAAQFYRELSAMGDGIHLQLNQFSQSIEMIIAVTYKQHSNEMLQRYEGQLIEQNKMDRNMDAMFSKLLARETSRFTEPIYKSSFSSRFQIMKVPHDVRISDFVKSMGITFSPGRGFYEFTKKEIIQAKKEVIVKDLRTGDIIYGKEAREILGLPTDGVTKVKEGPRSTHAYKAYIQSTSYTRKLIGGTDFLYEVHDYERV